MSELEENIPIFLMAEQPTTCPYCGNRTQILLETITITPAQQLHLCHNCNRLLIEEESK